MTSPKVFVLDRWKTGAVRPPVPAVLVAKFLPHGATSGIGRTPFGEKLFGRVFFEFFSGSFP
ncbi:hypothetical protein SAMN04487905_103138 [Actinopolyspora xinjiangensis]|uniref:Uncharacterized protein n=1 Tax=Actinopolyspora xinjiangensis TaxID=405564 RepID=A0A1H0RMG7_9ACTN|nr:hypothetical protein [Actinopolyspora xinjiangensis]SDP30539.1 hypothetical protein SAMN04487905_103138 [Actinopolyspora xinjiangensis]